VKRLLVCGGRAFADDALLAEVLERHIPIDWLIEGEAPGADRMARNWAVQTGVPVLKYPADWDRYGKAAGPIRNQFMLDDGKPTHAVAFYDRPRGESKGTADMVRRLKKAGVPVEEIGGE
jgi:hypothetical protein